MSELKVDKISPATGANKVSLGDSGDTIEVPSGATFTNLGTATGFGGGKLLQTVQTIVTATSSVTSTSQTSFISRAITPTATTSKILVTGHYTLGLNTIDATTLHLVRDSTEICLGDAYGSTRRRGLLGSIQPDAWNRACNGSFCFLDPNTPSDTTTAITYYLKAQSNGSGSIIYINRSATGADDIWDGTGSTTLILQEIGA